MHRAFLITLFVMAGSVSGAVPSTSVDVHRRRLRKASSSAIDKLNANINKRYQKAYVNSFPKKKETAWQRHHRKKTKTWTAQDSMLPDFLKHDDMESVREKEAIERCGRPCSEMKVILGNVVCGATRFGGAFEYTINNERGSSDRSPSARSTLTCPSALDSQCGVEVQLAFVILHPRAHVVRKSSAKTFNRIERTRHLGWAGGCTDSSTFHCICVF
jgi:hypothetical protein